MKINRGLFVSVLVSALVPGILGTVGCGDDEAPPTERGPYDATEPKFVLANVELAFNRDDVNLLSDCLAADFVFYFDVNDIGEKVNGYTIPTSWTRQEFLTAAGNLFAETHSISLANHWRETGTPAPSETSYLAADVDLEIVVMVDAVNGYALEDGVCDYEFSKTGARKWHLYKWRDRSRECGCLGPVTLGLILARYHP